MKVAIVTETFPPEINGVARTIGRMVDELLARGHEILLCRPGQGKDDLVVPRDGLTLRKMWSFRIPMYKDLRFGLPQVLDLVRAWTKDRPDLVQIVTEGPLGLGGVLAARFLKIPVVSDFHTNFQAYAGFYRLGPLLKPIEAYMRLFHNLTALTMAPTRQMCELLEAKGYRNLEVVGRGADLSLFSATRRCEQLRASWGVKPGEEVVIYVGRLAQEKNPQLLIEAWHAMRLRNPSLHLVLVGDGPARSEMETALPEAIFCGMQRGEELARHYASGDIFLFPSLTETFGNVVVEAMASGLAIMAYEEAAALEYLRHDESAFLAPSGDAANFVELAARLATDSARIERFRTHARLIAQRCSWTQVIDDLERLLYIHARQGENSCRVTETS